MSFIRNKKLIVSIDTQASELAQNRKILALKLRRSKCKKGLMYFEISEYQSTSYMQKQKKIYL